MCHPLSFWLLLTALPIPSFGICLASKAVHVRASLVRPWLLPHHTWWIRDGHHGQVYNLSKGPSNHYHAIKEITWNAPEWRMQMFQAWWSQQVFYGPASGLWSKTFCVWTAGKYNDLGCYNGPRKCCFLSVVESNFSKFCGWRGSISKLNQIESRDLITPKETFSNQVSRVCTL